MINNKDVDFLIDQISGLVESKKIELPSEYAERVRKIPPELTPFKTEPFSFNHFPYFHRIMDSLSPTDPIKEVVLMKGNQMGATTSILETALLYNIGADPKAQLYITADAEMSKTSIQTRIDRMIDEAGLRHLIFSQTKKNKGSEDSGDTATAKQYPGGFLHSYGSKSPARFRNQGYPFAAADEVDAYPDSIKKEGDVISLVRSRTNAYSRSRKILWISTPLVEQSSKIYRLYLMGDQEKFFVPCKFCGEYQELVWHGVKEDREAFGIVWKNDDQFNPRIETVGYKCPHCGGIMKNYDKDLIIPKGEWRSTAKARNPMIRSFQISPLYNPQGMYSWEEIVFEFSECWDLEHNRLKDKEKYRTFRNTKQGLPFTETGTQIKYERVLLYRRFGFARGHVPNVMALKDSGSIILIVVASVDVQKDRMYVDVKGYSARGVTWTLDFHEIKGETADLNGPWDELEKYIQNKRFISDDGHEYRIIATIIDSGWNTEYVYAFASRYNSGVYACKGVSYLRGGETYKLFDKGTLERIGLQRAYHINTGKMKDRISNSLTSAVWNTNELQPPWYANFPEDFHDDYFKQFEAENKVDEYDRKTERYLRTIWKARMGVANHAFDTYNYNMAILEILADAYCREYLGLLGVDWDLFWRDIKEKPFYIS
jgi:phage terminase large subunit GpA-like protein